ncbi:MAG: NADH:flavin oxidoreductase [Myxococcales bacterium]|nr:NADH:flavin oxidoreductase [Myxococcales bacterium]
MWHPKSASRHALLPAEWPSRDRAAHARWFSPIRVGRLNLERRTWIPAMVPWRASDDGLVTADVLDWYARFARGRPGALVVEATGIRDVPSGPLLRIGHDRFVPGLRELVDTVRRASDGQTRVFIQLIDFLAIRKRPEPGRYLRQFLQITDRHRERLAPRAATDPEVRDVLCQLSHDELELVLEPRELEAMDFGARERVTDVHLPHVRDLPLTLPGLFADAAARAEAAGFDGAELHCTHAYTLASFLSALNDRADGYGRTLEGRLRVPLAVLEAVRARAGSAFVVGCRSSTEECIAGGTTLDESTQIATRLARAGLDFLSLSRGGKFEDAKQPSIGSAAYPYTGPSGWECMPTTLADAAGPFGRNVAAGARIRRALRAAGCETPVVICGGIATFAQAEGILERGEADVVGSARQSLADPDWFEKVRLGAGDGVRRCAFTNYCEGLDQKHKQVTCKLWDRLELDRPDVKRTRDGRRRLVAPY